MPRFQLMLILSCVLLTGCVESPEPTAEVAPAPLSSDTLVSNVKRSAKEAESTFQLLQKRHDSFRVKMLRDQVNEGIASVGQLEAHSEATDKQIQSARCSQANLYFFGCCECPELMEDFEIFVANETEENPHSEVAQTAKGRWLYLKYIMKEGAEDEAYREITQYSKMFPDSQHAVDLFVGFCGRLINDGQIVRAKQVYKTGVKILTNPKSLSSMKSLIAKHQRWQQHQSLASRSSNNLAAKVRTQLGGRTKGYFIFFSVDPKSKECNYRRCRGSDSAVHYVKNATAKGWDWKFVKAFPDTPKGYIDCGNSLQRLYGANTQLSFR